MIISTVCRFYYTHHATKSQHWYWTWRMAVNYSLQPHSFHVGYSTGRQTVRCDCIWYMGRRFELTYGSIIVCFYEWDDYKHFKPHLYISLRWTSDIQANVLDFMPIDVENIKFIIIVQSYCEWYFKSRMTYTFFRKVICGTIIAKLNLKRHSVIQASSFHGIKFIVDVHVRSF